jgi:phage baseplate assembly protein W
MATLLGLTLPLRRGTRGFFENTTDAMVQIKANLVNLLLTKKGERPMQPTLGSNLHLYVFEPETNNAFANLQAVVEEATNEWMPFVQIIDVTKKFSPDDSKVIVTITFTAIIDPTNVQTTTLVF